MKKRYELCPCCEQEVLIVDGIAVASDLAGLRAFLRSHKYLNDEVTVWQVWSALGLRSAELSDTIG